MNCLQTLRVHEVRMELGDRNLDGGYHERRILRNLSRKLNIDEAEIASYRIVRESIDARRDLHFKLSVDIELRKPAVLQRLRRKGIEIAPSEFVPIHERSGFAVRPDAKRRPIVVGFGPAGIFAALQLAYAGLRPIVLEQGADVDRRTEQVAKFWKDGVLDPYSNVQFGEGGAGTFSDGKLTTRIKDERISFVLREMVACGAPESIRYQNKPHIGTDLLTEVVRRLRMRILALGGEVHFGARVVAIDKMNESVLRVGVRFGSFDETVESAPTGAVDGIETEALLLATGHSGREMFQLLHEMELPMERKPFAVGFRVEHPQSLIDESQYGAAYPDIAGRIGASDYKLTYTTENGRSVYSFCMCPGGRVVGAASEHGHLVVNGMSYHARKDPNANSALLVNVDPADLGDEGGVLAGVEFQRRLERAAYRATSAGSPNDQNASQRSDYFAPAQTVGAFLGCEERKLPAEHFEGFETSFEPGILHCDLRAVVPAFISDAVAEALPIFGKKIKGFDDPRALLIGVESRSSSPVRILRDPESLRSRSGLPIYPCGEGAGYAGGITSAAVDGVRAAEAVIRDLIEEGGRR